MEVARRKADKFRAELLEINDKLRYTSGHSYCWQEEEELLKLEKRKKELIKLIAICLVLEYLLMMRSTLKPDIKAA